MKKKKLDIFFEEKHRAEEKILYITKIYMYVFGFLFVYTGFVAKTFLQIEDFELNDTSFTKYSVSVLGLFLILVISTFGKYGTIGIAHAIKRRFEYTYEINKIIYKSNVLRGLDMEHFAKIPVIYTWTTTIIIAGSIFYFILMLGVDNPKYLTGVMITVLLGLIFFPQTNTQFFYTLHNSLTDIYKLEGKVYRTRRYKDKSKLKNNIWLKLIKWSIVVLVLLIESILHFTKCEVINREYLYICFTILLILIEYIDIQRKTNRKCFYERKNT